jgi:hypothetical protein
MSQERLQTIESQKRIGGVMMAIAFNECDDEDNTQE